MHPVVQGFISNRDRYLVNRQTVAQPLSFSLMLVQTGFLVPEPDLEVVVDARTSLLRVRLQLVAPLGQM